MTESDTCETVQRKTKDVLLAWARHPSWERQGIREGWELDQVYAVASNRAIML